MTVSKCPNCGGSDLYRSEQSTPASGMFGPNLLAALSPGRLRVVVCKDCVQLGAYDLGCTFSL